LKLAAKLLEQCAKLSVNLFLDIFRFLAERDPEVQSDDIETTTKALLAEV
jgi:hypothetical protein